VPPPPESYNDLEWLRQAPGLISAGISVTITVLLTSILIYQHLSAYHAPKLQRHALRVVLMTPVYAVDSYISLSFEEVAFYFDTLRDVYEAYVIYNFVALFLAYMGGASELVDRWRQDDRRMPVSYFWSTCCLANCHLNGVFLRRCLQGVLQFMVVKLILTVGAIVTFAVGRYDDGQFKFDAFYLYEVIIYNISICVALYALVVFYFASQPYLAPFHPVLKFVLVKSIIFVTWWQGEIIAILGRAGIINASEDNLASTVVALQDYLICHECVIAAVLNFKAFPTSDFKGDQTAKTNLWKGIRHAVDVRDVIADTANNFSSQYRDFVQMQDDDMPTPGQVFPMAITAPTKGESMAAPLKEIDSLRYALQSCFTVLKSARTALLVLQIPQMVKLTEYAVARSKRSGNAANI